MKGIGARIYGAYNEDGLLDIVIGLSIVLFALSALTEFKFIAPSMVPLLVLALGPLRRALSVPRLGEIEVSTERSAEAREEKRLVTLFFLATLAIGLLVFVLFIRGSMPGGDVEGLTARGGDWPLALFLVLVSLGLAGVAVKLKLWRYLVYASLVLVAITIGLAGELVFERLVLGAGLLILGGGFLTLAWFLIKYPKLEGGNLDDLA